MSNQDTAVSVTPELEGLVLYHFDSCPFCRRVRAVLQQQGWIMEERDILQNGTWRDELLQGGGKTQVPCLRIEQGDDVHWMYESADIVRFIEQRMA